MKTVSREELYALVWQTPMYRLGERFGISGNGLAKICDRLAVPYPPRGYWAKKAVGKAPGMPELQPAPEGIRSQVQIYGSSPKSKPSQEEQSASRVGSVNVEGISVPDDLSHAHRIVREWLVEHKRKQKERAEENRRSKRDPWGWSWPLIDDLTERDLYRFRVTSAIFAAVEKAGGAIEQAPITGKITFLVGGRKVECSIVEKLTRPLMKPTGDAAKWTAFPEHHQTGLHYTGFLRVEITTYLGRSAPKWIETKQSKIGDRLPEIVGVLMGAGVILAERERQREEDHRRYLEAEARRQEIQRQRELDAERWKRFRDAAANWDEFQKLEAFTLALERRLQNEGDIQLGERSLSEWLEWARERAAELDPFRSDLRRIFVPG